MGLDMYLNRKTFIWKEDREKLQLKTNKPINPERVQYIEEQLAYWRKANAIHYWFVRNLADDIDNCQEIYVSADNLRDLLKDVNTVLASIEMVKGDIQNGYTIKDGERIPYMEKGKYIKDPTVAEEILPTQSGFFFGSTNYDQWYYEDLINTKEQLETILAEIDEHNIDEEMYYQASW